MAYDGVVRKVAFGRQLMMVLCKCPCDDTVCVTHLSFSPTFFLVAASLYFSGSKVCCHIFGQMTIELHFPHSTIIVQKKRFHGIFTIDAFSGHKF